MLCATPALAGLHVAPYIEESRKADAALTPVRCPINPGPFTSISIAVGGVATFILIDLPPAPPGGARFRLQAENPRIVAAGDRRQSFLPEVSVQEGQTTSDAFTIFGIALGQTIVRTIPLTEGYVEDGIPTATWELGNRGNDYFVDANPEPWLFRTHCRENDLSPRLTSDPFTLSHCGAKGSKGAVTDGVSPLLMRLSSGLPGTACFEVVSGTAETAGSMTPAIAVTQTVPELLGPVLRAFSVFTPPAEFDSSDASRTVDVEVTFTLEVGTSSSSTVRVSTTLVRPPVVLVHGIWGSQSTFADHWVRDDATYSTFKADYQGTNADTFAVNAPKVRKFVAQAVRESRRKGYATTKADVVGHSMGGLLARIYVADAPSFIRPDNLDAGDIRKIVTIDSPHLGTGLANLLISLYEHNPLALPLTLFSVFRPFASGAVCNLAENSAALAAIGPLTLPSLVVTSSGGGLGPFCGILEDLVQGYCRFEVLEPDCPTAQILPYRFSDTREGEDGANDCVVPVSSQRGSGSAVRDFGGYLHTNGLGGPSCTEAREIRDVVLDSLDSAFSFATDLPAPSSTGDGLTRTVEGRGAADGASFRAQCRAGGPMNPGRRRAAADAGTAAIDRGVEIVMPTAGEVFTPGDRIHVVVRVDDSMDVASMSVATAFALVQADEAPYEFDLDVPQNVAGPVDLLVGLTDAAGRGILGAPVRILVRPVDAPERVGVGAYVSLDLSDAEERSARVVPVGVYADGMERALASAQLGTTYATSDPSVVTVDPEGTLAAVGPGTASITTRHRGLTAFTTVDVTTPGGFPSSKDVTSSLAVRVGGFRPDRNTGFFVQQAMVVAPEDAPVPGPLVAVLSSIPAGVSLVGNDGVTEHVSPVGSPFFTLTLADGLGLRPGEQQSLKLQFLDPARAAISYGVQVVRAVDP